jgi:DNA-binding GntR family transcriptional regulator
MAIDMPLGDAREHLAHEVRRRIFSGQLQPGQRLREAPLAEEFGTSRGPIRDTFLRLTQEGLLEARPNAGVRVAQSPSAFKRRTLVQLRRTIETNAVAFCFEAGTDELLTTLTDNLSAFWDACNRESLEDVVMLDMAFHRHLVEAADDGSLLETWLPVISQMLLRYSRHRSLVESYHEHAAIVEAIRNGDRKGALLAVRRNIV